MPVVNGLDVLRHAFAHRYAVAAFNANTLEQMMAIASAAEAEQAPVFLQISQGTISHLGLELASRTARAVAELSTAPIVLHLDHGQRLEQLKAAVQAGLSSLMFDGSRLPFEENVARTAEAARLAHTAGLPLEAELGHVPKNVDRLTTDQVKALMTDPDQAADYVLRTGIDSLAVAVGSVHGMAGQGASLDLDRLRAIRARVTVPFVSHGTSGVRDENVLEAVSLGLIKINVATRLNHVFTDTLRRSLAEQPDLADPRPHLAQVRDQLTQSMRKIIHMLGGSGRARGNLA